MPWHYQPPATRVPHGIISDQPLRTLEYTADYTANPNRICIRFNDLREEAQNDFVRKLLRWSSIYSLRSSRAAAHDAALNTLTEVNPAIAASAYRHGAFGGGNMPKWREAMLSKIVYWCNFCRRSAAYEERITQYRDY